MIQRGASIVIEVNIDKAPHAHVCGWADCLTQGGDMSICISPPGTDGPRPKADC
jgi:hypothetical protein